MEGWEGDGGGSITRAVHPLDSLMNIPVGDRIETTLFLKCHSNAKKLKNPLISSPTDYAKSIPFIPIRGAAKGGGGVTSVFCVFQPPPSFEK